MGGLRWVSNHAERRRARQAVDELWPGETALSVASHFHDEPIGLTRDVLTTKRLIGSGWGLDHAGMSSSPDPWIRVGDIVSATALGRSTYIVVTRHGSPILSRGELPLIPRVLRWRSSNARSFFAELSSLLPRDRRWPPPRREPVDPRLLGQLALLQLLVRPGSESSTLLAKGAAEVATWVQDHQRSPGKGGPRAR